MTISEVDAERLEARLDAHREVLALLVAYAGDGSKELTERLSRRDATPAHHAEDPGAVPDRAFAIEAAFEQELHMIAKQIARIREASGKG
ncbi:hypothetical protein OEW28_10670 [Defluviimonas sp. WL0002]|uniref:Uncharacterized protein n=1 Tax=Albidovulum marisflavi TaxID=2984159 RepID=A0ABT2ZD90_9RHOB|nr:hypothetical protein [Defluviimonas sp. WL0002]MCV2869089.1 hypothetical protein [Defluviimonas sp. WL0002]